MVDKNRDYAQVLEERDANGTLAVRYVYGLDLIAQVRVTNPSYYHYDGLGSTRQLTDASASAPTDTYTYEAFGRVVEQTHTGSTATPNHYLYTGEQYDGQTSSYYLRARYYQPGTGRFTGRDAAEGSTRNPLTLHKYLYCNADPATFVDPSGHEGLAALAVSATIIASLNGILGGVLGGMRNGIWGAIGGFAGSFISSFASVMVIGWLGGASAGWAGIIFGIAASLGSAIEMSITYGLGYLRTIEAFVTMGCAFVIGYVMGYLGGAATKDIAKKLARSIFQRPGAMPLVKKLFAETADIAWKPERRRIEYAATHPGELIRAANGAISISFGKAAADTLKSFFFSGGGATVSDALTNAVLDCARNWIRFLHNLGSPPGQGV